MAGLKGRVLFIIICIGFIISSVLKISSEGVVKNSLADEFYSSDSTLIEFKEYTKHFNPFSTIFVLIERKDQQKFQVENYLVMQQELDQIFNSNLLVKNIIDFKQIRIPEFKDSILDFSSLIHEKKVNQKVFDFFNKSSELKNIYFSSSGKAIRLPIFLKDLKEKDSLIKDMFKKISFVEQKSQFHYHLIGPEILRFSIFQEIINIQLTLLPIIIIIVGIILFILFRNTKLVVISLSVLGFSFASSAGILYSLHGAISAFSTFSLLFVFIIGTSDLVHLFSRALEIERREKKGFCSALCSARDELLKPCFLTTLTTIVGLLSLVFSSFKTLHQFGVNGCVGMALCFFITFLILPELLKLFKVQVLIKSFSLKKSFLTDFKGICKLGRIHFYIGLLIFLLTLPSLFSLSFQDDFFNKFTDDHDFSKAVSLTQKHFKGLSSLDLVGPLEKIEFFVKSSAYKEILGLDVVHDIQSFYSVFNDLGFNSEKTQLLIDNFTYLADSNFFVSRLDVRVGRVKINLKDTDSEKLNKTIEKIEIILNQGKHRDLKISGYGVLRNYFTKILSENYINSLLLTFVLIFMVFLFTYKSLFIALLAMIPNIVPPLFVIFLMDMFNIKADMNIALICSMTLAISVDDTIHFFYEFMKESEVSSEVNNSIKNTLTHITRPLIGSSLIISITLLIFTFGNIRLFSQFSVLLSLALLVALYYDLIVLPALIVKFKRFL